MLETLISSFDDISRQLPQNFEQEEAFLFDSAILPALDAITFDTNMICILKRKNTYNDTYRIEHLDFHTNKQFYTILGLLLLQAVFKNTSITLNLTNQESFIKQIKFGYDFNITKKWNGLVERPIHWEYWAQRITARHYYYKEIRKEEFYPCFYLLPDAENPCITDEEWERKNVLEIAGNSEVIVGLAQLLLNIGNKESTIDEIIFESAPGYQAVATGSVEMTLWLPGSIGWDYKTSIPEVLTLSNS